MQRNTLPDQSVIVMLYDVMKTVEYEKSPVAATIERKNHLNNFDKLSEYKSFIPLL